MMENWPKELSETARQAAIDSYPLGTELCARLERLAQVAASLGGAPIGLVSFVETDRQRIIARSGTELTEIPREHSFCAHAMLEGMIVPDARNDPRFRDNPLVTGPPFIRFYAGQPLISRDGIPLGSLCVIDGKPHDGLAKSQLQELETLAEAAMGLLDCERLERSKARSNTEIADLQQRFQILADVMPQLVWSTAADGSADYFNLGWCEFTGHPAERSHGSLWTQFLHDDERAAVERRWSNAVATGEPYDIEHRLLRHDGEYRWVLARGLPMRNEAGEITRWIGTCTDIQEQKAAAERLEMLSRELSHRIKNIFAVIVGLIALSMRSKPELAELGNDLRERVLALGRAHDFVRSNGGALPRHGQLTGLLNTMLAPYQDSDGRRIVIRGDDVAIDDRSATPLALFFHELATNAAKYGALSNSGGHIEIGVNEADQVELVWAEFDGPPISGPGEPGFGLNLVEMSVKRQLGGTLDYDWRADGLRITARIPAEVMAR